MVWNSVILEIPVEILHLGIRIENPLRIPLKAMQTIDEGHSTSESLNRLSALSRSFPDSDEFFNENRKIIIRDLRVGRYWLTNIRWESEELDSNGLEIQTLESIARLDGDKAKKTVSQIVRPFAKFWGSKYQLDPEEVLAGIRLQFFEPESEIQYLRTKIICKDDGKRKKWIHDGGPFSEIIEDILATIPRFKTKHHERKIGEMDWPFSPEVVALRKLENTTNKDRANTAKSILNSIQQEIANDKRPRLGLVMPVAGFRREMWANAQAVIHSSNRRVLILSSFTNIEHIEDIVKLISDSIGSNNRDIILAIGEPDRRSSPDDIEQTKQFVQFLHKNERLNIKGGISPNPSHAKVIVSDTGMVFLCSCNIFSGRLDASVLESGLLIKDLECAIAIIKTLLKEEWIPTEVIKDSELLLESLQKQPGEGYELSITDEIKILDGNLRKGGPHANQAITDLERLLRQIAERPVWGILETPDHRPFMLDCIRQFNKYLVMASDGLRPNGLDKATINRIDEQAMKSKGNIFKVNVFIWWGRHTPGSEPYDDDDKKGRMEAKQILHRMRELANKEKNWWFVPNKSNEPMETHAKMFIVDNSRLMVSSDNTLSFSDTESEAGDAGELGIMIDHPRLAMQMRGSMELWLPNARIPTDWNRWWAALAEQVYNHVNLTRPDEKIPLEFALNTMIDKIESIDSFKDDWENNFEKDFNQHKILENLARGMKFGLFSLSNSRITNIQKTTISLSQQQVWKRVKQQTNMTKNMRG